eukprot:Lithocolla_globosa_v1_NODE_301_length_4591_cov_9.161155.p3 type:complete len:115 gc:universal NODE_301_length_4591_cov_9.161155:3952-4296(+)
MILSLKIMLEEHSITLSRVVSILKCSRNQRSSLLFTTRPLLLLVLTLRSLLLPVKNLQPGLLLLLPSLQPQLNLWEQEQLNQLLQPNLWEQVPNQWQQRNLSPQPSQWQQPNQL